MRQKPKRKILFITYYYHPASMAAAMRMLSFARVLDEDEFEVHIIIPDKMDGAYPEDSTPLNHPHHIHIHRAWSPNLAFFRRAKEKNQQSIQAEGSSRLQTLYEKIIFPDKGFLWARTALRLAVKLHQINGFSVVFSSSPLVSAHWVAMQFKRKTLVPWLCEFRDFYVTNNSLLFGNKEKAIRLEASIFYHADHFLFVSKKMRAMYELNYPGIKDRTSVVLNGADVADLQKSVPFCPAASIGKKIIFYAGTFYNGLRDPGPFLTQMNQLIEEGKIDKNIWEIHIAGQIESHLLHPFRNSPVHQILHIIGPLPRSEVISRMKTADIFWLVVPDLDSHRDTIPAKVFEYLYFRKPIIAYVPKRSAVMDLLHYEKYFLRIPSSPNAPVELLLDALHMLEVADDKRKSFAYDREAQARKFQDVLRKMILGSATTVD